MTKITGRFFFHFRPFKTRVFFNFGILYLTIFYRARLGFKSSASAPDGLYQLIDKNYSQSLNFLLLIIVVNFYLPLLRLFVLLNIFEKILKE